MLELLGARPEAMSHGEIARALRIPKSSMPVLLATLEQRHYVVREGAGTAERMRLGRFLHGSVQATLTSTALQIETSLARGQACDAIASTAAAHLAHLAEEMDRREMQATSTVDVSAVLGQIASVWSRVAEITCEVSPSAQEACSADPDAAEKVVEIVRECVGDAVKHGRARDLVISVQPHDPLSVMVTIDDDGRGLPATITPGLGSQLLDQVCLSWQRIPQARGTRVAALVPVNPEPGETARTWENQSA